jgi:predicted dithiol-disulfide oxidoreductase (DUF899 family)
MNHHTVVTREQWTEIRKAFLAKEKAFTRLRDELSAERRELPWVKVEKTYVFDTPEGRRTLADLFRDKSQLIVKHFMMAPGQGEGCEGCSFEVDQVEGARMHFEHHDVAYVAVARAPVAEIEAYRRRMGWTFPFVSSSDSDFNYDFHVSFTPEEAEDGGKAYYNYRMTEVGIEDLSGISVFYKNGAGEIFHTYSTYGRGGEEVLTAYAYLDMTPKGRNETGPDHNLGDWVRRHDRYEAEGKAQSCCGGQA